MELLCELRQRIESGGFKKERDTAALVTIYGPDTDLRKTLRDNYLTWVDTAEAPEEERQREGYATPEQCKKNVLSEIDKEIRRFREYGRKRALIESERTKLEVLRHSIPQPARLDRLLRYEASLERSFARPNAAATPRPAPCSSHRRQHFWLSSEHVRYESCDEVE
jgi:hypothetical protein